MQMGILGSNNIEYVWEIGGVANEFKNGDEFLFLQSINIVDGDDDGAVDML